MKALQNNSEWISQVYEQESGEGNWKVADVSFKQSRFAQSLVSATTSSATILSPDGGYSSSQFITVGNSTDGEVSITAPVTNIPYAAQSGSWNPVGNASNHWDSANSGITDYTHLRSALMTPDGTVLYRKYYVSDTWYKFTLATPFQPLTAGNTFETTFSLSTQVGDNVPGSQKATYVAGGNYVVLFGYRQKVAVIKLGTPYLLETAVSTEVVDLESTYRNAAPATWGSNYQSQMFNCIKLNVDGTKGILGVRGAGSTTGHAALSNSSFADFTLATPFDFNTLSFGTLSGLSENNNNSGHFINYFEISEDGKYLYFINTNYQYSYGYFRVRILTTPWDLSGGHSRTMSEYSTNFTNGSATYSSGYNGSLIFDDTAKIVTGFGLGTQTLVSSWSGTFLPKTELDITSASLTVAPTSVLEDNTAPTVSIQAQTKADFNKEDKALSTTQNSSLTSLKLLNPPEFRGDQLIQTGDTLVIDGLNVTAGTTTYTSSAYNFGGSYTTAPSPSAKANAMGGTQYPYLAQTVSLNNRGTVENRNDADNTHGFTVSPDGKRLYIAARQATYGFGDTTITEREFIEYYTMSTPWDFSTLSEVSAYNISSFPRSTSTNYFMDFCFSPDGTKFFNMSGFSTGLRSRIDQYSLSTPWDLSTISRDNTVEFNNFPDFNAGTNKYYSISFSDDGLLAVLGFSNNSFNVSTTSYNGLAVVPLSTPYDISTFGQPIIPSGTAALQPAIVGDSQTGYFIYGFEDSASSGTDIWFFGGVSGNGQAVTYTANSIIDLDNIPGYVARSESFFGGKIFDSGSKLILYFPQTHTLEVFNGSFGPVNGEYTVDVTSANLQNTPKNIRLGTNTTYESLGSATLQSSTSSERTYAYTSKSIDAEALRFKIDGDEGDEIKQLNVDLFTS